MYPRELRTRRAISIVGEGYASSHTSIVHVRALAVRGETETRDDAQSRAGTRCSELLEPILDDDDARRCGVRSRCSFGLDHEKTAVARDIVSADGGARDTEGSSVSNCDGRRGKRIPARSRRRRPTARCLEGRRARARRPTSAARSRRSARPAPRRRRDSPGPRSRSHRCDSRRTRANGRSATTPHRTPRSPWRRRRGPRRPRRRARRGCLVRRGRDEKQLAPGRPNLRLALDTPRSATAAARMRCHRPAALESRLAAPIDKNAICRPSGLQTAPRLSFATASRSGGRPRKS